MSLRNIPAEKILDAALLLVLMFFTFLSLGYVSRSVQFSKSCEKVCGDVRSITPLMGGQEQCFCDEGHGKWRRAEISVSR